MPQVRLVIPGQVLQVSPYDTIRVQVAFTYVGPDWRETLYAALYKKIAGVVDEIAHNEVGWNIPRKDTPTSITELFVDVSVPNYPGQTFGIYAKLGNILSTQYDNVIQIMGAAAPTPTNFRITSYTKL